MAPKAPVPHVTHPRIVHARPLQLLDRVLTPFVAIGLIMVAIVAWVLAQFHVLRPGVNVTVRTAPAPAGPPTDTGVAFVPLIAERGPIDAPVLLRNMGDYEKHFGERVPYNTTFWDWFDSYFRDGGRKAYGMRAVGGAATVGTLVLKDQSGGAGVNTLTVNAINPGAWSTDLQVQVTNDGDTYELIVSFQGDVVERTGVLASPTDAVVWSTHSNWVTIVDANSATVAPDDNPVAIAATPLSAGADDHAAINDAVRIATLALLPADLGPGQVVWPGGTTDAIHVALNDHARERNRTAILDLPDDGTVASMVTSVLGVGGSIEPERSGAFGPQAIVPGLTANTTRIVPMSAIVCAAIARNDAVNGTFNPAAGVHGQSGYAIGVTNEFTDDERGTANDSGVNIVRPLFGPVTIYGFRTASTDPAWRSLADQRLRMEVVNLAEIIGEEFMFAVLDGQGHTISSFGGALTGMLLGFYGRGALFGATPEQAFVVNVGDSVNTIETIANGELHAVIGLRMSPFAEVVFIEIVKYPITQQVA